MRQLVRLSTADHSEQQARQANGSRYTSTDELPLVPGTDGVGSGPDGLSRSFLLPDTTMGSLAQQTVIDVRRSIVLPRSTDPVAVAAAMNPAMSSWVALRQRIQFRAGQNVLVLGATGNAGKLAVQTARHLGANKIIAAGRSPGRLAELPALADEISKGTFTIDASPTPLSDVRQAWADAPPSNRRIVVIPGLE